MKYVNSVAGFIWKLSRLRFGYPSFDFEYLLDSNSSFSQSNDEEIMEEFQRCVCFKSNVALRSLLFTHLAVHGVRYERMVNAIDW